MNGKAQQPLSPYLCRQRPSGHHHGSDHRTTTSSSSTHVSPSPSNAQPLLGGHGSGGGIHARGSGGSETSRTWSFFGGFSSSGRGLLESIGQKSINTAKAQLRARKEWTDSVRLAAAERLRRSAVALVLLAVLGGVGLGLNLASLGPMSQLSESSLLQRACVNRGAMSHGEQGHGARAREQPSTCDTDTGGAEEGSPQAFAKGFLRGDTADGLHLWVYENEAQLPCSPSVRANHILGKRHDASSIPRSSAPPGTGTQALDWHPEQLPFIGCPRRCARDLA